MRLQIDHFWCDGITMTSLLISYLLSLNHLSKLNAVTYSISKYVTKFTPFSIENVYTGGRAKYFSIEHGHSSLVNISETNQANLIYNIG